MNLDLGDLDVFVAVARARSFRDAARATGRSASAVSEAVRRLEEQLGVRLLHRTTRSVAPTEAGARLLDRLVPARWSRCSSLGGRASRGRSSIIRDAGSSPRRCAPSSNS
ncbi:LysR family transcriptional regulator [Sorangium sp. So ce834]